MKKGVYEAQQQCRKFRTEEKDWSPKTTLLGIIVLFWKLACNRAYGAKVQRRYHARLRKRALLQTVAIPDTNAGIVTTLKQDMSQWRKYSKAEAADDIKTLLQKKATAIAEEKNTTMEKIMKHLRLRESQKYLLLKSRWFGANFDQEAFPELLILMRMGWSMNPQEGNI
jgi:hypothetical protein